VADESRSDAIRLGVLDCWHHVGDTIELAEEADRLGYSRYWLTEHQPQPNPQMVAALVAGVTQNIRVGTAGILLHFHAPLAAAQLFLLLEHAYSGRIDAGFCAGHAVGLVAEALLDGRQDRRNEAGVFDERAATLIGFLRNEWPAGHPYANERAWPLSTGAPEVWSFGTGLSSARIAARHGTSFGYSLFHKFSRDETASVEAYRNEFQENAHQREPSACIAVAGVCGETQAEVDRLLAAHQNPFFVPVVAGTPAQVHEQLAAISERYATREMVFMDLALDFESRQRSLRLLAEELSLAGDISDSAAANAA
jgi:luciferase family oxidoreductase group 1